MNNTFKAVQVTEDVWWVGAIDWNIRDFHGYRTGRGSTYNAYLVLADKITLIDTVKAPFREEMMERMMESFEERNQAFDEAARSFCTGFAPLAGNAAITFTGMLPPRPGEKSDKDDDDEDMGMILDF